MENETTIALRVEELSGYDPANPDHAAALADYAEAASHQALPSGGRESVCAHWLLWVPVLLRRPSGAMWGRVPQDGVGIPGFKWSSDEHRRALALLATYAPRFEPVHVEMHKLMWGHWLAIAAGLPDPQAPRPNRAARRRR